ncbi:AraC family transcriptional regulator [Myroides marinus]|jgi:AraC-like DNA-binding protein|uniref:AraC-type DNA-binding protein n=1 Tax=Myroides marinus TaxID=703342 RepID=A0A1H6TB64_9FLAO|nr:helix-turn-helix domain-containing protein [Myroides marinus]MDR0196084.1 helix-turn-helix domain-containing protein [Myroides sp.]KUF38612.1 AraC family transcriptional regulator [Myroides marinus]MDM1347531.1 AraC family transcriptional regulator [Myroides marinus]MDM1350827.1 AraC family transcriptional regulator [Myroides marinus]MDM1355250.1 AraC family transcriptional regulator [Myroides marinus]
MDTSYIQVYSLSDITNRYKNVLTDKRLAILDIGPKHKQYFVIDKPYQFTTFGLILVTEGRCEITINLEPTIIKKDDLLVVLPNQFFEIKRLTDDFAVKTVFIDPDLFLEAGFHVKSHSLISFLSSEYPKVITLNKNVFRIMNNTVKRLTQLSYNNNNIYAKNLIIHHFSILMYELGNFYSKAVLEKNDTKIHRREELAKKFIYLVSTHFKKERSVQYYAEAMFISRKHLTKIIVEVFQKTPKQIITDTIILEAKILLKNPKTTITDIVNDLNFQDLSVFSKFFKTYTGISPTDFKNS